LTKKGEADRKKTSFPQEKEISPIHYKKKDMLVEKKEGSFGKGEGKQKRTLLGRGTCGEKKKRKVTSTVVTSKGTFTITLRKKGGKVHSVPDNE